MIVALCNECWFHDCKNCTGRNCSCSHDHDDDATDDATESD